MDVVAQLKKRGIRHPFVKNYVLARTTPLSRARKTVPSFDQALDKLIANIEGFDVAKVRYDDVQTGGDDGGGSRRLRLRQDLEIQQDR